jgi:hypothetical protein
MQIACLTFMHGNAQPILNANLLPSEGTHITIEKINGVGISPGLGGANQSWDFSSFQPDGNIEYLSFSAAESTPYFSYYPLATLATLRELSNGSILWNYYTVSTEELILLGSVEGYTTISNPVKYEFTNTKIVYSFPAGIDSMHSDNYRKYSNESMGLGATAYYESGFSSYEVDGYGTLITESGTYPNCLRIKYHKTITDSTFNVTPFGPPSLTIKNTSGTHYEWLSIESGFAVPVWSIELDTVSIPGFPSNNQLRVSQAEVGLPSSTKSSQRSNALGLYPNPANDKVLILLPADATVSLFDLSGRMVLSHEFSVENGNMPILETTSLPSGTYLMKALGKNYSASDKLIVVH